MFNHKTIGSELNNCQAHYVIVIAIISLNIFSYYLAEIENIGIATSPFKYLVFMANCFSQYSTGHSSSSSVGDAQFFHQSFLMIAELDVCT